MELAAFITSLFSHLGEKGPGPDETGELLSFAEAAVGVRLDGLAETDKRLPAFKNRVKLAFFSRRLEVMAEKFSYGDAKRVEAFKNLEALVARLDREWESLHKPTLAALKNRPMVPFAVAPDYRYDRMGRPLP